VAAARADDDDPAHPGGDGSLAVGVVPPGYDGAVGSEGQAVVAARADGDDPTEAGGDIELTRAVIAPGGDGATAGAGDRMGGGFAASGGVSGASQRAERRNTGQGE